VCMEEIKKWLTCDLDQLSIPTLSDDFHLHFTKIMATFHKCASRDLKKIQDRQRLDPKQRVNPSSVGIATRQCLKKAISSCQTSSMLVIKFIRLRIRAAIALLPYFPNLKIVHLVRDPRGILNSQKKVGLLNTKDNNPVTELCSNLEEDLTYTKLLMKTDPNRVMLLQYEDIAEDPFKTTERLYNFANADFSSSVKTFITKMTSSSTDSCNFCTQRKNSSATAAKWRSQIKFQQSSSYTCHAKTVWTFLGICL